MSSLKIVSTSSTSEEMVIPEIIRSINKRLHSMNIGIGSNGQLRVNEDADADDMMHVGRKLYRSSKQYTLLHNMALGAWWYHVGSGKYGDGIDLLRKTFGVKRAPAISNSLRGKCWVYAKWMDRGIQFNHTWEWHRSFKPSDVPADKDYDMSEPNPNPSVTIEGVTSDSAKRKVYCTLSLSEGMKVKPVFDSDGVPVEFDIPASELEEGIRNCKKEIRRHIALQTDIYSPDEGAEE